jgi:hypothetical protein
MHTGTLAAVGDGIRFFFLDGHTWQEGGPLVDELVRGKSRHFWMFGKDCHGIVEATERYDMPVLYAFLTDCIEYVLSRLVQCNLGKKHNLFIFVDE